MDDTITTIGTSGSSALSSLEPLRQAARSFASKARSKRTKDAYLYQWSTFTRWCDAKRLTYMPTHGDTLALYLTDRAGAVSVATLSQALSAISEAHRMAGHTSPRGTPVVQEVWKGIRRTLGTAPHRVAPAVVTEIRAMVAALPRGLGSVRTRALLVVGFAGAFRRSELVALQFADCAFTADGLVVTIRRSKTDQEGAGVTVGLPYGSDRSTCPVRTLQSWIQEGGITDGPLYRSVDRHGTVGASLTGRSVATIVKRAALGAGLDPSKYAGHSLRSGLATSAAKAGKSDRAIMKQGRWTSRTMVDRYVREATILGTDNAATGIGL